VSRSLDNVEDEQTAELDRANATFGEMIGRGRSYSGRERNCAFLNTGDGRFANISATTGIDLPDDGRALVTVDWDHDGDLDVWISNRNAPRLRFFRNDVPSGNHHLNLRLRGTGPRTSRDAIGARVEVVLAGATAGSPPPLPLHRTLRAGDSFLSQSSKWMHFGLGQAETVEAVRVRWPGGESEIFTGLEVNGRYLLEQGTGMAAPANTVRPEIVLSPGSVTLPEPDSAARIPLTTLLPMASFEYRDFEDRPQQYLTGKGQAVLLNLWASWCTPCLAELEEFGERADELRAAGIEVVALAVDSLDDSVEKGAARKIARRLKLPFPTGQATRKLVTYLQTVHDTLITSSQTLPVPASFLIDGEGRIAVIYKGRLNPDDLAADMKHAQGSMTERFSRSAPLPGRTLPEESVSRRRNQFEARYRFATFLQQSGYRRTAEAANVELIKLFPENAGPYNNLGISYISQKKLDLAEVAFRGALRAQPDHARAHSNLGTLLAGQGKTAEAVGHFRQAVGSNPREENLHRQLVHILVGSQKWAEAETCLEEALVHFPRSADFRASLGLALAQQNKLPEAEAQLQQALVLDPRHPQAKRNLQVVQGMIAQGQGQ